MGRKKNFFFANDEQESLKNVHKQETSKNAEEKERSSAKQVEKEKKKFQVFGQKDVFLSNIDFIDYQKINNKMLFLQFHLMGQFDENGKYYIKEDIKRDLVHVQKEIQEEDDKGFLAEVRYAKVLFNFEVEIEYEDAEAKASLFIIEKVDDQTIKTLLDSFSDANDADFRIKVRQRFNLVDVAVAVRDEEVPNLNIWIYWQNEEYLYWKDLYEMGSQFFVLRALAILEGYGELGAKIIERYNAKLSQFEDSLPNRKYTKAKEILDEVLGEFGGIEKVDEGKGKLQTLAEEFNKPFYVSVQTQAMLYEKDSTNNPAAKKAETKQEDYGWGDNGKFISAAAGTFGSAKPPKQPSKAVAKLGKVVASISPDQKGKEEQRGNADQAQKQEKPTGNADQAQKQETQTEPQDKVDDVVMNDIKEELGQDSGAIASENTEDLPGAQRERKGSNIDDASNVIVGNQSDNTIEIEI